ncbi:2-oxo acid dehydrogenase subunit E2 [Sphingomonas koreensis]|jgi:2-oxoisovalerate dehydrogenase E2 component (dihydrolipoyl transacylase)|uniref:Dihydrolipoamide acetyltransferase component of pyruvate dehydrogenase complex n=1 Tax=Sphingomonas koreensis TaxID=93064 RepID=A0A1L6J7C1_9SPHN|nr:dihydrolipoamide acetyltransferase family protein [Sphingomonas koreensis]APR51716.1 branched-chain alpha-keto acid dehydrogenase subunit E2 [Sphingomonas koreensis]MDC7811887.1 dihydrolipoamide acetyltransferase family protein [Sphingomonas koreensis]RSU21332.1 2-oxo acid dehydrogenase subunit E2 [Sphingomonas koreensis]RSU23676.1 2-oxo acid dehydrogenase subunit E2 [Sphingomonas koreensis]RSU32103.1 2-oxo acid dehydrogenase subunit E2 [Sphingomonas koreensis]
MARFTFRLPDIGEGIAEAEIVAWHVKVGDRVEEDQQVADMMTDKATVEMESPVSGIVVELAGEVGDQVAIGAALIVVETDGDAAESPEATPALEAVEAPPAPPAVEPPVAPEAPVAPPAPPPAPAPEPVAAAPAASHRDILASPAVRQRAKDLGIDLSQVKAAEGDRIRHADLDAFLRYGSAQGYHAPHASRAREDVPVKVIGMRRKIAENMAASKRTIPHFTYVDEIDVTALEEMRADLNANRGARPKLTMLPFVIAAICRTLPDFPMLNARYDDEAGVVTRHGRVHMGMATQTDAGLMVPVIRDAQDLNVWQLAAEITRLAEAARTGKAKVEELSGSTITITSLGPLGGIATTPVINKPEVAIIGPNKIVERPVFVGDDIVRAKLMNLSISCDHRVVDGWDAASYVQALRKLLETPVLLFAD